VVSTGGADMAVFQWRYRKGVGPGAEDVVDAVAAGRSMTVNLAMDASTPRSASSANSFRSASKMKSTAPVTLATPSSRDECRHEDTSETTALPSSPKQPIAEAEAEAISEGSMDSLDMLMASSDDSDDACGGKVDTALDNDSSDVSL